MDSRWVAINQQNSPNQTQNHPINPFGAPRLELIRKRAPKMPKTKQFASSLEEPAEPVDKNSQILTEYFWKSKESNKKNGAQF